MVFSSAVFLFFFLPLVLPLYFIGGKTWRNALLVVASLFFYAWGEGVYILVLLASITFNFILGLVLERLAGRPVARWALAGAVLGNLGLLGSFKYAGFIVENVNAVLAGFDLPGLSLPHMHLPLGISFFSFHAMSYVIDVYRREVPAQRNPLRFAALHSETSFLQSILPVPSYGIVMSPGSCASTHRHPGGDWRRASKQLHPRFVEEEAPCQHRGGGGGRRIQDAPGRNCRPGWRGSASDQLHAANLF